jgi:hypothetical protein
VAASGAGYLVGRARADGIPATMALTYSGVLTDTADNPLSGTKSIEVRLWDQATGGVSRCDTPAASVTLDGGRFRIPLVDDCTMAVHASPDLWVEVVVDNVSLSRTKLATVPYAAEAQHAETASAAAGDLAAQLAAVQNALGTERVGSAVVSVAASSAGTATATCSTGKIVLGGGCIFDQSNDNCCIFPLASYPDSSTTYSCRVWNATGATRYVQAYAICASF